MLIIRKVQAIGNSLIIVLPTQIRRELEIKRGDYVSFELALNQQIIVKKIAQAAESNSLNSGPGLFGNEK